MTFLTATYVHWFVYNHQLQCLNIPETKKDTKCKYTHYSKWSTGKQQAHAAIACDKTTAKIIKILMKSND